MRFARAVSALALTTLVLAACGDDDDDDGATPTTEAEAGGEPVAVTAVDFAFQGLPEEMAGGVVTFEMTNEGATDHEIAFVNIGDEANAAGFFDDFGPVIQEGAAWPDYVSNVVGANEAPPGETGTFTYTLDPGTYMVFCALTGTAEDPESEEGPPHFVQGMQQVVTVTEGEGATELPDADGTITARDYEFDVDLEVGDQTINFTNEGPNDHFAGIEKFPAGTTVADAEAAFETFLSLEEGEEPPAGTPESEEIGFSGIASQGQGVQFELPQPLEAGTYAFVCFISDRAGGPPHAIGNHMITVVEIA